MPGRSSSTASRRGLRVDSGVRPGSEVTLFYDSLLAKAITSGDTREAARTRLVRGLRDFALLGPATTLPFLADALEQPIFARGEATTRFIEDAFPGGWRPARRHHRLARAVAAVLGTQGPAAAVPSAWSALAGFRVLAPAGGTARASVLVAEAGEAGPGAALVVAALPDGGRQVRDAEGTLSLCLAERDGALRVEADGRVLSGWQARSAEAVLLMLDGEAYRFSVTPAVRARREGMAGAGSGAVLAPMPGVVAELRVAAGEAVAAGQVVAVLESMKLFTSLAAGIAGTVAAIDVAPGETVPAGRRLLLIAPKD